MGFNCSRYSARALSNVKSRHWNYDALLCFPQGFDLLSTEVVFDEFIISKYISLIKVIQKDFRRT